MMACRLCQGYKLKAALVQDQVKDLEEKIKQMERINNALLNTLQNCQHNQNWKFECDRLIAQNHTLKVQLNSIIKTAKFQHEAISMTPSAININWSLKKIIAKDLLKYQTPRRDEKSRSSQKMSVFMSTIKKNLLDKNSLRKPVKSTQSMPKRQSQAKSQLKISKNTYQSKQIAQKQDLNQRKNIKMAWKNPQKGHKLAQIFEPSSKGTRPKISKRTWIEMLAEE